MILKGAFMSVWEPYITDQRLFYVSLRALYDSIGLLYDTLDAVMSF